MAKERHPRFRRTGGTKYYKEEYIPLLRKKLSNKMIEMWGLRQRIKALNAVIKEQRKAAKGARKLYRRENLIDAHQLANRKLSFRVNGKMEYLNAVLGFPLVRQFCKDRDISYYDMRLLLVMSYYRWFVAKDGKTWGYLSTISLYRHLKKLVEQGYIDKDKVRVVGTYTLTEKGKGVVRRFKVYFEKKKQLIELDTEAWKNRS